MPDAPHRVKTIKSRKFAPKSVGSAFPSFYFNVKLRFSLNRFTLCGAVSFSLTQKRTQNLEKS